MSKELHGEAAAAATTAHPSQDRTSEDRYGTVIAFFRKERTMNKPDGFARGRNRGNGKIAFLIHLVAYVLVNAGLIGINLSTSTQHLWFKWPLLGWGIGIILHGLAVFVLVPRARAPQ